MNGPVVSRSARALAAALLLSLWCGGVPARAQEAEEETAEEAPAAKPSKAAPKKSRSSGLVDAVAADDAPPVKRKPKSPPAEEAEEEAPPVKPSKPKRPAAGDEDAPPARQSKPKRNADQEASEATEDAPTRKPKSPKSSDSTKTSKSSKSTKRGTGDTALPEPIPEGALDALDQALGAFLTEKRAQPVVVQEAAEEGAELTVSIETLDQSLDALLKKTKREPATTPTSRVSAGLGELLESLKLRGAAAGPGTPHTAALASAPPDQSSAPPSNPPATPDGSTPGETSSGTGADPGAPATPPPPMNTIDTPSAPPVSREVAANLAELAPLATPARRYVLTRIAISKDGGPETEMPVPQGGALRPIPLAHRGGNPPVEMKALLRVPGEVALGESTSVVAQASAQAAGVAADLSLADEVVDSVRAADGAETTSAAGMVTYTFLKKVGGVFSYQQTFAQGDGHTASTTPTRSILLNWTDRDATIEFPFVWATTSPSVITVRGRLVYAPAGRP